MAKKFKEHHERDKPKKRGPRKHKKSLNKATDNLIKESLNLEASDVLEMQAGTANEITGAVSYALIDRSQENG